MYKKAAQLKLRFETTIGTLSVEQLFTLPVNHASKPSLRMIAVNLHEELNKTSSTGLEFLDEDSKVDEILQLKFNIVKDIIETKKAEASEKVSKAAKESELRELKEILAEKKGEAKKQLTVEELEKQIAALQE